MTIQLALLIASIVIFCLVALGAAVLGLSLVQELGFGLALFAASRV